MENDRFKDLIFLYALGELTPDEASEVEAQIKDKPDLLALVEEIRQTDESFSDDFDQLDESDDLKIAPPSELVDLFYSVAQQKVVPLKSPKSDIDSGSAESRIDPVKSKIASTTVGTNHNISTEKKQSHLAHRLAFSVAALALVVVVGALLYPQLVSKDVFVAMSSKDTEGEQSDMEDPVPEDVKPEETTPGANDAAVPEETPQPAIAPAAPAAAPEIAPAAAPGVAIDEEYDDVDHSFENIQEQPSEDLSQAKENPSSFRKSPESSEPDDAQAEYSMKNALYNLPGQKLSKGVEPIEEDISQLQDDFFSDSSLEDMVVNQMNKQLGSQRNVNPESKAIEQNRQDMAADAAPVHDSYETLRKSVLEENKLPNPESVKVEQWLNYFGVAELAKTTEDRKENVDDKDAQFVKAVNQFGVVLSSSEPSDVKAFEEVLDLLKDSVGDDAKRLEFKAIVEKAIEIKKKSE